MSDEVSYKEYGSLWRIEAFQSLTPESSILSRGIFVPDCGDADYYSYSSGNVYLGVIKPQID
nr:hypothetical protein [uncultured Carboxylicivirga sp.]